jgi:hypothetical protein
VRLGHPWNEPPLPLDELLRHERVEIDHASEAVRVYHDPWGLQPILMAALSAFVVVSLALVVIFGNDLWVLFASAAIALIVAMVPLLMKQLGIVSSRKLMLTIDRDGITDHTLGDEAFEWIIVDYVTIGWPSFAYMVWRSVAYKDQPAVCVHLLECDGKHVACELPATRELNISCTSVLELVDYCKPGKARFRSRIGELLGPRADP